MNINDDYLFLISEKARLFISAIAHYMTHRIDKLYISLLHRKNSKIKSNVTLLCTLTKSAHTALPRLWPLSRVHTDKMSHTYG